MVAILVLSASLLIWCTPNDAWVPFSGLYNPNLNYSRENFAGSWLVSVDMFISKKRIMRTINNIEGASFIMAGDGISDGFALMTRDYFDFQVIHLSSTTNNLEGSALLDALTRRMRHVVKELSKVTVAGNSSDSRLYLQTVAIIPFSSTASGVRPDDFQFSIRKLYMEATFWSIKRHITHIVVTVASKQDLDVVNALRLPIWLTVDLSEDLKGLSTRLLPKKSLIYVADRIHNVNQKRFSQDFKSGDDPWSTFKFVYYTEADQILHIRKQRDILDTLDTDLRLGHLSDEAKQMYMFALIPHRMQVRRSNL